MHAWKHTHSHTHSHSHSPHLAAGHLDAHVLGAQAHALEEHGDGGQKLSLGLLCTAQGAMYMYTVYTGIYIYRMQIRYVNLHYAQPTFLSSGPHAN